MYVAMLSSANGATLEARRSMRNRKLRIDAVCCIFQDHPAANHVNTWKHTNMQHAHLLEGVRFGAPELPPQMKSNPTLSLDLLGLATALATDLQRSPQISMGLEPPAACVMRYTKGKSG